MEQSVQGWRAWLKEQRGKETMLILHRAFHPIDVARLFNVSRKWVQKRDLLGVPFHPRNIGVEVTIHAASMEGINAHTCSVQRILRSARQSRQLVVTSTKGDMLLAAYRDPGNPALYTSDVREHAEDSQWHVMIGLPRSLEHQVRFPTTNDPFLTALLNGAKSKYTLYDVESPLPGDTYASGTLRMGIMILTPEQVAELELPDETFRWFSQQEVNEVLFGGEADTSVAIASAFAAAVRGTQ